MGIDIESFNAWLAEFNRLAHECDPMGWEPVVDTDPDLNDFKAMWQSALSPAAAVEKYMAETNESLV